MSGKVVLSDRLLALCAMVTVGNRVVDVGCDHGFLSIYLVQDQISPGVLAMDVRKGPLSAAKEHVAEYELGDYIETRLSDGLMEYRMGEADSLVCAGMGGRLMQKILTDSREKARGLQELILQPQSELPSFRRFLRAEGYCLLDENILCEEGKYYFLMKVSYRGVPQACEDEELQELGDHFGSILLQRKHPVLREYLRKMQESRQQIIERLRQQDSERTRLRLAEMERELILVERALDSFWEKELD